MDHQLEGAIEDTPGAWAADTTVAKQTDDSDFANVPLPLQSQHQTQFANPVGDASPSLSTAEPFGEGQPDTTDLTELESADPDIAVPMEPANDGQRGIDLFSEFRNETKNVGSDVGDAEDPNVEFPVEPAPQASDSTKDVRKENYTRSHESDPDVEFPEDFAGEQQHHKKWGPDTNAVDTNLHTKHEDADPEVEFPVGPGNECETQHDDPEADFPLEADVSVRSSGSQPGQQPENHDPEIEYPADDESVRSFGGHPEQPENHDPEIEYPADDENVRSSGSHLEQPENHDPEIEYPAEDESASQHDHDASTVAPSVDSPDAHGSNPDSKLHLQEEQSDGVSEMAKVEDTKDFGNENQLPPGEPNHGESQQVTLEASLGDEFSEFENAGEQLSDDLKSLLEKLSRHSVVSCLTEMYPDSSSEPKDLSGIAENLLNYGKTRYLFNCFTRPTRQFVSTDTRPDPVVKWSGSKIQTTAAHIVTDWSHHKYASKQDIILDWWNNKSKHKHRRDLHSGLSATFSSSPLSSGPVSRSTTPISLSNSGINLNAAFSTPSPSKLSSKSPQNVSSSTLSPAKRSSSLASALNGTLEDFTVQSGGIEDPGSAVAFNQSIHKPEQPVHFLLSSPATSTSSSPVANQFANLAPSSLPVSASHSETSSTRANSPAGSIASHPSTVLIPQQTSTNTNDSKVSDWGDFENFTEAPKKAENIQAAPQPSQQTASAPAENVDWGDFSIFEPPPAAAPPVKQTVSLNPLRSAFNTPSPIAPHSKLPSSETSTNQPSRQGNTVDDFASFVAPPIQDPGKNVSNPGAKTQTAQNDDWGDFQDFTANPVSHKNVETSNGANATSKTEPFPIDVGQEPVNRKQPLTEGDDWDDFQDFASASGQAPSTNSTKVEIIQPLHPVAASQFEPVPQSKPLGTLESIGAPAASASKTPPAVSNSIETGNFASLKPLPSQKAVAVSTAQDDWGDFLDFADASQPTKAKPEPLSAQIASRATAIEQPNGLPSTPTSSVAQQANESPSTPSITSNLPSSEHTPTVSLRPIEKKADGKDPVREIISRLPDLSFMIAS